MAATLSLTGRLLTSFEDAVREETDILTHFDGRHSKLLHAVRNRDPTLSPKQVMCAWYSLCKACGMCDVSQIGVQGVFENILIFGHLFSMYRSSLMGGTFHVAMADFPPYGVEQMVRFATAENATDKADKFATAMNELVKCFSKEPRPQRDEENEDVSTRLPWMATLSVQNLECAYLGISGILTEFLIFADAVFEPEAAATEGPVFRKNVNFFREYAYLANQTHWNMLRAHNMSVDPSSVDSSPGLFQFATLTLSECNDWQKFLVLVFRAAQMRNLKRIGDTVYRQMFTRSGVPMHAWEESMTLHQFVFEVCGMNTEFENWRVMTSSPNNLSNLSRWLGQVETPDFPTLKHHREFTAWRNGIYERKSDTFYPYGYDDQESASLPTDVVCVNYFDQDFPGQRLEASGRVEGPDGETVECLTWDDIDSQLPTPAFDSILASQKFDEYDAKPQNQRLVPDPVTGQMVPDGDTKAIRKTIFGLLGRLQGSPADDNYQIFPFFRGKGNTGKSTICQFVGRFYPTNKVVSFSNTSEKQYVWSSVDGMYLVTAAELKGDFNIDQGEFQQFISHEAMMIKKKHHDAKTRVLDAHIICAGNVLPAWLDNAGSMARRAVIIDFLYTVREVDSELTKKLVAQMPNFYRKCALAYSLLRKTWGSKDAWHPSCLPPYFHKVRTQYENEANVYDAFFRSVWIEYDETVTDPKTSTWLITDVDLRRVVTIFAQKERPALQGFRYSTTSVLEVASKFDIFIAEEPASDHYGTGNASASAAGSGGASRAGGKSAASAGASRAGGPIRSSKKNNQTIYVLYGLRLSTVGLEKTQ